MKLYRWARITLLIVFLAPLFFLAFGGLVMYLWNNALVPVLQVHPVTFWQAVGILVLSKLLFGNFSGGRAHSRSQWRRKMRDKWEKMTPEQREKLRGRFENRFGTWKGNPWESEGSEEKTNPGPTEE